MPFTLAYGAKDEAASGARDRLRRRGFALAVGVGAGIVDAADVTNGLAAD